MKSHAMIGEDNFADFFFSADFFSLNRANKFTEKGFDWLKKIFVVDFLSVVFTFFVKPVMRTV